MNSSRGSNAYGQQQYAAQQTYGQNSGADGSSLPSRQSSMQGSAVQEADIGAGYRGHHPLASTHFGGPYGAVYGSTALSSAQQVGPMSDNGATSSALQGRTGYSSGIAGSPMFASADYISSSSHGYGPKSDQLSSGKLSDYSIVDRRHYDLQSEVTRRYTDSVGLGHQLQQPEIYDRIDQASLLRQQQLLKSQSIQSASPLDGGARPADYLAARGAPIRHSAQDLSVYGGRLDADPRTLSMLSGLPYDGQHQASSILGAAPRRNADDLMYAAQGSATSGYGVSLPPGRDYGNAKGLHVTSRESDYSSSLLSRGGGLGGSRMEERKDDRGTFRRELEIREEERRRDHVRVREERERERDRERERERERRDKDRERESKRVPEIRRERTPPRITRERPGSALGKEEKSLGRDLQRHDSQQRRHSPVKEKRREYVCKVYPSCLVDVERDYLSVSKRYPRLFVSPDFTKAVVNWPKENQNISFSTPVSFEHDLVEVESLSVKKEASVQLVAEPGKPTSGATIWNAKVMLMSGISKDALEELSSNKNYEDRIPHINNILRFSFLRKDRAFMAIGGPQGVVDGGDSSVDDCSLIKTAISYTKDITQLDLQKCQQWNRFLEIHYDRLGKDGLFSHKEITVLYIPDLSECLPSLEAWRDQLLAHKKAIAEREQRLSAQKNKKSVEKNTVKGGQSSKKSDKDADSTKTVKVEGKLITPVKEEKKESDGTPSRQPIDSKKIEEGGSEIPQDNAKDPENKDEGEGGDDGKALEKKGTERTPTGQGTEAKKSWKKKIVKKVVKLKIADKKAGEEITISTNSQKGDVDKQGASDTTVNPDGTTVDPSGVKTLTRKKVVKKVPAGKTPQKEDKDLTSNDTQDVLKLEKPVEGQEDEKDNASVQQVAVKTSGKKKIIKRVPKRKASLVGSSSVGADDKKDEDNDEKKVVLEGSDDEKMKEQAASAKKVTVEEKKMVKKTNKKPESIKTSGGKKEAANSVGEKDEKVDREKKGFDDKKDSSAKKESNPSKEKSSGKDSPHLNKDRVKNANEKKGKDEKDDSRHKLSKIVKEKGKDEEPPRYPGLVLQTKSSKDSKIRSMSLSLDALLDYNDKDIDESTFELSLFAEALYEMLQYQMGCRLLTFLQKLRLNFVKKRDQRKRERDENPVKQVKPSKKKLKTTEATPTDEESTKDANSNSNHKEELIDGCGDSKMDDEADDYDPEEDVDDDQEMEAEFDQHDKPKELQARNEDEPAGAEVTVEKGISETNTKTEESALGDKTDEITAGKEDKSNLATKEAEVDTEANKKPVKEEGIVDKELLQAFRFFDRNRLGYIKVEDLRSIIHNLGKFISHRDVKELVQSGLIESNTYRDNRILYNKLVKLSKCDI